MTPSMTPIAAEARGDPVTAFGGRRSSRAERARLALGVGLVLAGVLVFLTVVGYLVGILLMLGGVVVLFVWALMGISATGSSGSGTATEPGRPPPRGLLRRLADLWYHDPKGMAIDLLRAGVGFVWVLNLLFIVDPSNQFFPTFQDVALSFAPTSIGGPGIADFVAAHAAAFVWITAILTGYLAVAFVLGITTRLACIVGGIASVVFLATQFLSTFQIPGGTDVGPHPLYLLIYLVLYAGGAGRYLAVDHWIWISGHARFPRFSRWVAAPRE